jgi:hypothetical protein
VKPPIKARDVPAWLHEASDSFARAGRHAIAAWLQDEANRCAEHIEAWTRPGGFERRAAVAYDNPRKLRSLVMYHYRHAIAVAWEEAP